MSWPRLFSAPNFSPSPYTASPDASANAAVHKPPWRKRPKVGRREKPRKCSSVIEPSATPFLRSSLTRSGAPVSSSVVSPDVNVHAPLAACCTSHALVRACTMP